MSPVFPQCQYVYLHQCIRDVLRARKLRSEQENPLFPIYENVNPEYHRGKNISTNLQCSHWEAITKLFQRHPIHVFLHPDSGNREQKPRGEKAPSLKQLLHLASFPQPCIPLTEVFLNASVPKTVLHYQGQALKS